MPIFRKTWDDIRPNLYYDLLKWAVFGVVAAMTSLILKWIQHLRHAPQQDTLGYVILGVLIFIGLSVSGLSTFFGRRSTATDLLYPPHEDPHQLSLPKAVDLGGQIHTFYFKKGEHSYSGYQTYLYLRVTNRGPQRVTITNLDLYIQVGEERCEGAPIPLHENLRLSVEENSLLGETWNHTQLTPRLNINNVYETGIPHEGWVAFQVTDWGSSLFPVNGTFLIKLTDSLSGEHWIERAGSFYTAKGEITLAEPATLMASQLKHLIKPPE